jgi:hypothetical protein
LRPENHFSGDNSKLKIGKEKKINMESKTFAGTSARRYRIVDAEER